MIDRQKKGLSRELVISVDPKKVQQQVVINTKQLIGARVRTLSAQVNIAGLDDDLDGTLIISGQPEGELERIKGLLEQDRGLFHIQAISMIGELEMF